MDRLKTESAHDYEVLKGIFREGIDNEDVL
jgi:hypothetical protein